MVGLAHKCVIVTPPAAIIDNASATTAEIDTIGYDYAILTCIIGAIDIAVVALKVQEGDVSGTVADIASTILGNAACINLDGAATTLPTATDDNKIVQYQINLKGRKRFLDVVATLGDGAAGTYFGVLAQLFRGEDSPNTMAMCGCLQVVRI